jgi:DtxR family Mn-dependent transcriptional regulator
VAVPGFGKAFDMSDLIDTTEMYLRTVYEMFEDGVVAMRARIAEVLGHSGPTVSQTIARMERDGLVVVTEGDHHLEFTQTGQELAIRVMRKHRLAERLLTDVIGLDLTRAHEEACRWEHVMSDIVEKKLVVLLGSPTRSPYGNWIPGLAELGFEVEPPTPSREMSLEEAVGRGVEEARITRVGEPAQAELWLMDEMVGAGVTPGAQVRISVPSGAVSINAGAGEVEVDSICARHIFVDSA